MFEVDELCTQMVIMSTKCKSLEFYAVKWDLDTSALDQKEYMDLDDAMFEEDKQPYTVLKGKGNN